MREAWIIATFVAALGLVAAPLSAQQRAPTTVVACSGTFAKDSSHLKLAMFFDSKNITFTDVEASDGSKVPASILFPNDPKRRLEVWWSNETARKDIYLIVISGQSTWTAPGGLRLDQTLEQVEKLNHKPFKIKGFDKDRIATGSNWDGGALAAVAGGCRPGVSLRADAKASAETIGALSADKEYSSSDPAIRAAKPTVSEILIGYLRTPPYNKGRFVMANKVSVRLILVSAILPTLTLAAWLAKPSALDLATRVEAAEMSQDEFERRVHDYLLAHPEVVGEALYRLQEKQDAEDAAAGRAVLKAHAAEVFDDPDSPVSGNPEGDVTVVEFFDYNCPYCRVMAPVMEQAQAADPKLRIVYKEFPVLGPGSVFAAKAALAANKQGKYTVFHHALYQARGQLDEAKVLEVAAVVGLDIDRLKADMEDPAINGDLDKNTKLGELLHITGTPGFVVGDQVATGATELKNFQGLIAKARASHEAAK